jgi:hypothetical protein
MSHWHAGKLKLKCSIGVLRAALINIKKDWKDHIQVDVNGGLTIKSGYSQPDINGVSLKIPMNAKTGVRGADLGFNLLSDGTWEIHYDYLPYGLEAPENALKQEIARMKLLAVARMKNLNVVTDKRVGDRHIVEVEVPVINGRLAMPNM